MRIKLKEFRQTHHLKQSQMADILGTKQSVISRMEIRMSADLSPVQYAALCEKFGKDEVDAFADEGTSIVVAGNTNRGSGQQVNSVNMDAVQMEIIKKQADALAEAVTKQANQTERLLELLEKLSNKL